MIENKPQEPANILQSQARWNLSECLKELKYSRPATTQKLIDVFIAMAETYETNEHTVFTDFANEPK